MSAKSSASKRAPRSVRREEKVSGLKEKLLGSKKYRDVCPDTIERIWSECSAKYKKEKDVDKAAREALHGVTGAFMTEREYKRAMELAAAHEGEALLEMHASTRERLPIARMNETFDRIFAITGRPESVLDLACGLNPVYLAQRLPGAELLGVDISGQCVNVIRAFGGAQARLGDLLCAVPEESAQVALLFKVLPLLERQRAGAAADVLHRVQAEWIVASFPTRSLGGRNVGMEKHYSEWMEAHVPENRAIAARLTDENELFYVLKRK